MTTNSQHDPILANVVKYANAFGLEADVLLTLPGQIVGGRLVSMEKYFKHMADAIEAGNPQADPENAGPTAVVQILRRTANDVAGWGRLDDEDAGTRYQDPLPSVRHIHLLDTYVVDLGRTMAIGPWRGRLSSISAWTFGRFTDTED